MEKSVPHRHVYCCSVVSTRLIGDKLFEEAGVTKLVSITLLWLIVGIGTVSAQTGIDVKVAAHYFEQLRQTAGRDGGKTWHRPLYGPIFFVDPNTRQVVANQADREGKLQAKDGVFLGVLPSEMNPANTATDWLGVHWTMLVWPVPQFRQARERLLLHECFHRLQKELGLPQKDVVNDHLDSLNGRIWLQMEWRALERALRSTGAVQKQAITDALIFRGYRRSLFASTAENENTLELNEGLAEYTGVKLSSADLREAVFRADLILRQARNNPTFARSFAYVSGPAYGTLLDLTGKPWRNAVNSSADLGNILQLRSGIHFTFSETEARSAALRYEGDELIAIETRQEESRQQKIAEARKKLLDGPVLILPLSADVRYSYDPTNLIGIDASHTFYPTLRVVDAWGILTVSGGALMILDENRRLIRAHVAAPGNPSGAVKTDSWSLELKEGWQLVPGERVGDFVLKKAP